MSSRVAAIWCLAVVVVALPAAAATIAGINYQGVRATAADLGLDVAINSSADTVVWQNSRDRVALELDKRACTVNGTRVVMNFPLAKSGTYYYVSSLDVQKTFAPLINPRASSQGLGLRYIVIDPGHGGKDNGAQNNAYAVKEKTLALDIARRLASNLRSLGYRVTLTRNDDHFISLENRPALANDLGADLFISIHLNAAEDSSITGIETYLYPPQGAPSASRSKILASDKQWHPANRYDTESLWAAYLVQRALVQKLPSPDRGVKRARLKVLESARCPSILIENGFISSGSECSRLKSGLYRQQIADAIASGVQAYHRILMATR